MSASATYRKNLERKSAETAKPQPHIMGGDQVRADKLGALPPLQRIRTRRRDSGLPKYYSIRTVAEALDVSARTIRRWIASGNLTVHRVNGVVRIAEGDLRAFLALHREG
jgi:excisionase family DNA binding protein